MGSFHYMTFETIPIILCEGACACILVHACKLSYYYNGAFNCEQSRNSFFIGYQQRNQIKFTLLPT